ncbi:4-alpha-glucanotransferase, partial [Klebsiella aerogenes]
MENKRLDNAALAAGISPSYINAHGQPQSIAAATKQRLLDAMHRTSTAAKAAVEPLPSVKVFTHGKKMQLPVAGSGAFHWLLTTEEGKQYQGETRGGETLALPGRLPTGYHTLTLTRDGERWHCRAIVAPARCYEPQALKEGKKLWGACVQLYTLRSENNWGIGDFGDLRAMLPEIARRGGAFIGLNPIHALYPANPESASPYSPSSR